MANKPVGGRQPVDPEADLDLLHRAKASVSLEYLCDFGPWWYAPLLASCIATGTLFVQDRIVQDTITSMSWAYGAVGVAAWLAMRRHDASRRKIQPKWSAPTGRSGWLAAGVIVSAWVVVALWGSAVSTLGYDRFVPFYAALGWVLTTALLLGIRAGSAWLRSRRSVLS